MKIELTDDIGLHIGGRISQGVAHSSLGCQMQHRAYIPRLFGDLIQCFLVANIGADKFKARLALQLR